MRPEQAAALLSKTQLFGELDAEVLNRLAQNAVERTYKKGQLIFHQGDPADALFVVVDGLVKIVVVSEEGDEMVLVTLKSPDAFGELSLIDGGPRSASAEVATPTTLLVLTRSVFLDLMRDHPAIIETLLRSLGAALRRLTEQTADLVFLDLHGRVAKLLLGLAGDPDGEKTLDLHLTQTDLAGMVGGSRQSVNQILRSFERRGYVELSGRKIVLKEPDLLRRRAGH